MIQRELFSFVRNPKHFIDNMNIINELISYYIYENKNLIASNRELFIDNIDNINISIDLIENNLKTHTFNNQSINLFTNKSYNNELVKSLVELMTINNKINSYIKTNKKSIEYNKPNKNIDINKLIDDFIKTRYDNNKFDDIINFINNNNNPDNIDNLNNLINTKIVNNIKPFNYNNNNNDILNINNIIVNNNWNILEPHILLIIKNEIINIIGNDIFNLYFSTDNLSLFFWRALQYQNKNNIITNNINKKIKESLFNNDIKNIYFNLICYHIDFNIINNLEQLTLYYKYNSGQIIEYINKQNININDLSIINSLKIMNMLQDINSSD